MPFFWGADPGIDLAELVCQEGKGIGPSLDKPWLSQVRRREDMPVGTAVTNPSHTAGGIMIDIYAGFVPAIWVVKGKVVPVWEGFASTSG